MKKQVNFVLMLVLLLQLCFSHSFPVQALTDANEALDFDTTAITSAQVVQNNLYLLKNGRIEVLTAPGAEPVTVIKLEDYPEIPEGSWSLLALVSDGSSLYLLNLGYGTLYLVKDNALQLTTQLDMSCFDSKSEDGWPKYITFKDPIMMRGNLYVLASNAEDFQAYELYGFSVDTGARTDINLNVPEFDEIAPYQADKLLTVNKNTGELIAFVPGDPNQMEVVMQFPNYDDGCVFYVAESNAYYFLSGTSLMRYQNDFEVVQSLPFDNLGFVRYAGVWHDALVIQTSTGLFLYDPSADTDSDDQITLSIWTNGDPGISNVITEFMATNPNIRVALEMSSSDNALERLVNENLSNDTNTDLFVLSSFMINSHSIFSRGFAAPIYSETLQQSINRMYPQIQALLMQDDVLWGYPVNLYPDFWAVRPALLEKYGYAVPETMDEYVDMLLDWYANHADEVENVTFNENRTIRAQQVNTASMLLKQYILTHADGDTLLSVQSPQLAASIEKLASLSDVQEADVASDTLDHAAFESLFQTRNALLPFYRRLNPGHAGEVCMTAPAFDDGTGHVNSFSLDYFIINPHSENQEAAATFLEYLCNHMDTVTAYQCYPDENTPVETEGNREEILEIQEQIDGLTAFIEQDRKQIEMATESLMNAADGSEDYDFYKEYLSELQITLETRENSLADWINQKAELEENLYVYAAEDIAEYREVAQYMELQNSWIVWEMSNELDIEGMFEKYFGGYASLQQTLSEIDKRLLLMLYEEY